MKRFFILLICVALIFTFITQKASKNLSFTNVDFNKLCSAIAIQYKKDESITRLMTYNVLSDGIGFDGMAIETREDNFIRLIASVKPDVMCLQESNRSWQNVILEKSSYKCTSLIKTRLSCLMTTIFYNPQTVTPVKSDFCAYREGIDSRLRSYNWCLFERKGTNSRFIVINTHLSLFEKNARYPINQSKELVDFYNYLKKTYNCNIYLMGDFNTKSRTDETENASVYEYLNLNLSNTLKLAKNVSYAFCSDAENNPNDYIFSTPSAKVEGYVLLSSPHLNILSDHYPVFIDVS